MKSACLLVLILLQQCDDTEKTKFEDFFKKRLTNTAECDILYKSS